MSSKRTLMTMAGAAGFALAYSAAPAQAYIFDFVSVEEGTNGGFGYSLWHEATSNGGKTGNVVAVFGDDPANNNFQVISGTYDTVTGVVANLSMLIWAPSSTVFNPNLPALGPAPVGTITFFGNMGPLSAWNDNDNAALGTLSWQASFFNNTNPVTTSLQNLGFSVNFDASSGMWKSANTHYFNDKFYMGPCCGPTTNQPNSIDVDEGADLVDTDDNTAIMALWGGSLNNTNLLFNTGGYAHSDANTTLGFDALFNLDGRGGGTNISEPISLALLGVGLMGLGFAGRRRTR